MQRINVIMTPKKTTFVLLVLVHARCFLTFADAFTSPNQQMVSTVNVESTMSSSSLKAFRIFKGRNRVVKDPRTGFYRPAKSLPLPVIVSDDPSPWDQTKESVYSVVDGLTGLADVNPFIKQSTEAVISDGYSEVEQRVLKDASSGVRYYQTPDQRLMREYQQRNRAEGDTNIPNKSFWNMLKGAFYSTVDFAASTIGSSDDENINIAEMDAERIPPIVQESIASPPVQKAIAELQSTSNPIKQALARQTLNEYQRQREETEELKLQRQQTAESIKQTIFSIGDAATETIDSLAQLPAKATTASQKISSLMQRLPLEAKRSWRAVKKVPSRINETTLKVQSSIDETVDTTRQTMQEIAMIPTKAQLTFVATRQSVTNAVQAVDDVATKAKIILGLEKPIPKPPKLPPPKPVTAKDIDVKVVASLSKGVLQTSWWAGKKAAILSWKGAKFAVNKGLEMYKEQQDQMNADGLEASLAAANMKPLDSPMGFTKPSTIVIEKSTMNWIPTGATQTTGGTPMPPTSSSSTIQIEGPKLSRSVMEQQAEIDRQVNEALKMAEEALGMATSSTANQEQVNG
ncbi:hypothetical protein MPSEU_000240300 [Mayamaea pseudoterrestris]|nr:hypothetical protein MPSEU_000240300 [Mayamaea pseudoterrestris]